MAVLAKRTFLAAINAGYAYKFLGTVTPVNTWIKPATKWTSFYADSVQPNFFWMVPGSLPSSALIWWKDAPWAILAQIMLRSCNVKCECFAIGEYSYLECPSISDSSIHLHQLLWCENHRTLQHCKQILGFSLNRTIVSSCSYFINIFWFFSKRVAIIFI